MCYDDLYVCHKGEKLTKKKRKSKKIKEKGYLSNKEMFEELIICQKKNVVSDKLGRMFMILATRYSTKPCFSGYSYRLELVNSGIVACVAALHKFDPAKSENPFAYFTSINHNAFIQILNKEKRQQEIRDRLLLDNSYNPSFNYTEKHGSEDEDYLD